MMAAGVAADAQAIKGTVKDTDGKAVAGVVVSDGLNTVQTDAKGRFKMVADQDSRFVFISTPSGYVSSTVNGVYCANMYEDFITGFANCAASSFTYMNTFLFISSARKYIPPFSNTSCISNVRPSTGL